MNDNLITLSFKGKPSCISDPAWQYDYGQVAVFEDIELDEIFEVHFSNTKDKGLASVHLGENNRCEVPAGYFMTGLPIYGWVYVHPTLGSGETEYSFVIPVKTRPEPSPEENIPEPDLSALTHAVDLLYNALDAASASAEEAAGSAAGAKEDAAAAKESAEAAEQSADRAEQSAAQAGYMFFYIDENGDLIYQRTSNTEVDFYLDDGDLYARANL